MGTIPTSVHNNSSISIIDKFLHLKAAISEGDAWKLVEHTTMCERNYTIAIDTLEKEFNIPYKLANLYYIQIGSSVIYLQFIKN